MADFQGKSPRGAKNEKMEPFSIWLKFYTKTNLSAGNPLRGVSGFAVCLFILKNIHICCKLDISVNMAVEQG